MDDRSTTRATGDLDGDGMVGDAGDGAAPRDAEGGTGMTVGEIGAHGGGSPAARAAAHKRETTGESGPGAEAVDDPHYPNSR